MCSVYTLGTAHSMHEHEESEIVLSTLGHTWLIDLDGTIVKHNGYKLDGKDSFLSGAKEFLQSIPKKDMIVFITSRIDEFKEQTLDFLQKNEIRYDYIVFNAPYGERILVNDEKPSGLKMSKGINLKRDEEVRIKIVENHEL